MGVVVASYTPRHTGLCQQLHQGLPIPRQLCHRTHAIFAHGLAPRSLQVKGANEGINVKRLPKKPAPPRFGRKLTAAQKALATHICVDCGYIYCEKTPFDEAAKAGLKCEQCGAPPRRFARYDQDTGKITGGTPDALATNLTVVLGLIGVGVLGYLGLSL